MTYKHHQASYSLGKRELLPKERIVISTRHGPEEPSRIADHLGLSPHQPKRIIDHRHWMDGEYLPTFTTKACLSSTQYEKYLGNYKNPDGTLKWGEGLKGRTVYITHTFSNQFDIQALDKMTEFIAWTAKYNGAENVVLLAYTLAHSCQERGVHHPHPRMDKPGAKEKFDGQAPLSQLQLMQYATAGVDKIITLHNHCPVETKDLCDGVNEELEFMARRSKEMNSTLRYNIEFHNVDLSPVIGLLVSDSGEKNLEFDLSDNGRNVLFMAPDVNAGEFVWNVREHSGLTNSAFAKMDKVRGVDGSNVDTLVLKDSYNLNEEEGIEGKSVIILDDVIRSGGTMRKNTEALMGMKVEGIVRDAKIKGIPKKVAIYSTRTNFAGGSIDVLLSPAINDVIITNADPRGPKKMGSLRHKSQKVWVNFIMAEAAKAIERGEDPNEVLTKEYIREHRLIKVDIPHGHDRLTRYKRNDEGII
jgi:phosphoribosylpyrophosphate synthetase